MHHAYEVDLDAELGTNNEENIGHIPVDDDFLFSEENAEVWIQLEITIALYLPRMDDITS